MSVWRTPGLRAGLALLVLFLSLTGAQAHSQGSGGATGGIPIDNLTHGQMQVIAAHEAAILDLARSQSRTDPTFRRLQNFAALQRTYCLWGLMPGSLRDEESPFNECMHAYLATLRVLLLHMAQMPEQAGAVQALMDQIEREMIRREASLMLCQYSAEAFNTAEVVMPRWAAILSHGPSLLACGGAAGGLAALGAWLLVPRRRERQAPPSDAASGTA